LNNITGYIILHIPYFFKGFAEIYAGKLTISDGNIFGQNNNGYAHAEHTDSDINWNNGGKKNTRRSRASPGIV